jgi:hypothetical protein
MDFVDHVSGQKSKFKQEVESPNQEASSSSSKKEFLDDNIDFR